MPRRRGHKEPASGGEHGNDSDRRARARRVRDDTGEHSTQREPSITPEAIDTDGWGTIPWLHRIGHGGDERRIDERRADTKESRRRDGGPEGAAA